ncbi:putative Sterol-sensing domain-containing protein [Plasmopara halstedii]
MWLFGAISLAIATPCFRSWLETLFAELTIVFFTYLHIVSLLLFLVLLLALAFHGREYLTKYEFPITTSTTFRTTNFAYIQSIRNLRLAMLPIITSVVVCGEYENVRTLQSDMNTTMMFFEDEMIPCRYSIGLNCLDNVTNLSIFGDLKRERNSCITFDTKDGSQINEKTMDVQYFPIQVHEAFQQGYNNKFSTWNETMQTQFQLDCSLLYSQTIINDRNELLCCTEKQFERLSAQFRHYEGNCTSCMENIRNLWCQVTCNPSNSLFLDVNQVRVNKEELKPQDQVIPTIEEMTFYVGKNMVQNLYESCEADPDSMERLCPSNTQNCTTSHLFEQLGAYNSNIITSYVNFKTMEQLTPKEQETRICHCDLNNPSDCIEPSNLYFQSCIGSCNSSCSNDRQIYERICYHANDTLTSLSTINELNLSEKIRKFSTDMSRRQRSRKLRIWLYIIGFVTIILFVASLVYLLHDHKTTDSSTFHDYERMELLSILKSNEDQPISKWDAWITQQMKQYGDFIAMGNHPFYMIFLSVFFLLVTTSGLFYLEIEHNPLTLYVSESSKDYQESNRFREKFGPLDRIERLIFVSKDGGSITRTAYLKEAIRLQQVIAFEITSNNQTLQDFCIQDSQYSGCQINAITQYFQNKMEHFQIYETYDLVYEHFQHCVDAPNEADVRVCTQLKENFNVSLPTTMNDCPCVSSFGEPMTKFEEYVSSSNITFNSMDNVQLYLEQATALLSTISIKNFNNQSENHDAISWERTFLTRMELEAKTNDLFDIYYSAEISDNDEFVAASNLKTIMKIFTFLVIGMFCYVLVGLNDWKLNVHCFQLSKFGVALIGICYIWMGVCSTFGLLAWIGMKIQLVTLLLMPFITFIIEIENVFLLDHTIQIKERELEIQDSSIFHHIEENDFGIHEVTCVISCEALGLIGPSFMVSRLFQCCIMLAFISSTMPAIQWLAITMLLALISTFTLKLTFFLAFLVLFKRQGFRTHQHDSNVHSSSKMFQKYVKKYVTFLLLRRIKLLVLVIFTIFTIIAIITISWLHCGISRNSFHLSTSYLTKFHQINDKFWPRKEETKLIIVETGYGMNQVNGFQNLANDVTIQRHFCTSQFYCNENSIPNLLNALIQSNSSFISFFPKNSIVTSWLDEFWEFLNPESECCRIDPQNQLIVPNRTIKSERTISSCSINSTQVPENSFMSLFRMFLNTKAEPQCTYAGGTQYHHQFSIDNKPLVDISNVSIRLNEKTYGTDLTAFAYKIPNIILTNQDAVVAYDQTQDLAQWISKESEIDVWIYSPNSVYFSQFHSFHRSISMIFGIGILSVFGLQLLTLGIYGIAVTFIVFLTIIQVTAVLVPMNIPLNSLSIFSLAIVAMFSFNFSTHFLRLFLKTRTVRNPSISIPSPDFCIKIILTNLLALWTLGGLIFQLLVIIALLFGNAPLFLVSILRILLVGLMISWLNGIILLPVSLSIVVNAIEKVKEETPTSWYHM